VDIVVLVVAGVAVASALLRRLVAVAAAEAGENR
jgi:hypothetical protein